MKKELGKEYPLGIERENFIKDNADSVEEKGYMKRFSEQELLDQKDELSTVDIDINDIEEEKKEAVKEFKTKLKPLQSIRTSILKNLKQKAEFVKENCYKFIDNDTRMVSYFNAEGDLIETRPANADELQRNIFQEIRKNGTENK